MIYNKEHISYLKQTHELNRLKGILACELEQCNSVIGNIVSVLRSNCEIGLGGRPGLSYENGSMCS